MSFGLLHKLKYILPVTLILSSKVKLDNSSFKMSTSSAQIKNAMIVICGCTGTGKSELGVELAKQFNGEVINADSMQIYKGLNIVTNKLSKEEMRGIPHHLMDFLDPCNSAYNVRQYSDTVLPIIHEIWKNGKLPIIVGGTGYYIEGVMYCNNLIATDATSQTSVNIRQELMASFPTCELLHQELQRVDPTSAAQIHKNDKFRVLRALEVYHQTGLTKSEHHQEQRLQHSIPLHFGSKLRFKNTLLIKLDAEIDVLETRLDKRIDHMLENGLIGELDEFYAKHHEYLTSHGILQSIGLKEFIPYLKLSEDDRNSKKGRKLLFKCIDLMKLHTRQYAKNQRKWFYNRIILRSKHREVPPSIVLNTSSNFSDSVVPFCTTFVRHFLTGADINDFSPMDHSVLMPLPSPKEQFDQSDYESNKRFQNCEICGIEIPLLYWEVHLAGRRHRKTVASLTRRKRLADQSSDNSAKSQPE